MRLCRPRPMGRPSRWIARAGIVLTLLTLPSGFAASGQEQPPPSSDPDRNAARSPSSLPVPDAEARSWFGSWNWDLEAGAGIGWDTNPFKLKDTTRSRLEQRRPGDRASGRFDDMESLDDFVLDLAARLVAKHRGLSGRPLRVTPELEYEQYLENTVKSHPTIGLSLEQELPSDGRLDLSLAWEVDSFPRNYLTEATDRTGSVSASERVYRPGTFDEGRLSVAYRRRLGRWSKKDSPLLGLRRVRGSVRVGYRNRRYDHFGNRDRDVGQLGLGVSFDLGKSTAIDLGYGFGYIATSGGREVLIRDEPDFGADLNGDGDSLDLRRRTRQRVDRSHFDHSIAVRVKYRLAGPWTVWGRYDFRLQDFVSQERFDTTYRDRTDLRHRIRLGTRWKISKRWDVRLEGRWVYERALKGGVPPDRDEETTYDRFVVLVSLATKLF